MKPNCTVSLCGLHVPNFSQTSPAQMRLCKEHPAAVHTASTSPVGDTGELTSHHREQKSKQLCFCQTGLDFCLRVFALNEESSTAQKWSKVLDLVFFKLEFERKIHSARNLLCLQKSEFDVCRKRCREPIRQKFSFRGLVVFLCTIFIPERPIVVVV